MVAKEAPVVVCTYPTRGHGGEFVAVLRKHGIPAVAVPSDHHVGEWDVLVPGREGARAKKLVEALLA